ncbi:52 kDa repressor of the inhibitor of the protein kinase-like [Rhopilema esculentum]|uniref:52 kDa repressor of the inhibitor of the protein kinase-like n=1 Tax=Rhopilema esculentum TaxID=499914 RepID=UPI0031D55EBB
MLALSSATDVVIESYYPISTLAGDNESEVESRNGRELLFNSTILPRGSSSSSNTKIHIFRCTSSESKFPENKDYYVPLLQMSEDALETGSGKLGISKCRANDYNRQEPVRASKRTQMKIDAYAFKKAKFDDSASSSQAFTVVSSESEIVDSSKMDVRCLPLLPEASSASSCPQNDIGNFYQSCSSLCDQEKYDLLNNIWKPGKDFHFPVNSLGRRFQHSWLQRYPWLAYSYMLDGAFCINCVMFGGEYTHNASKLRHLFKEPFKSWSKALKKLNDHVEKSSIHKTATERFTQFRLRMQNKVSSVDVQLNHAVSEQVSKNREKLKPIVGAILLLARQAMALRGHRDDSDFYEVDSNNPGNLQEILSFLATFGNNINFQDHLLNAPGNATYRSKTTQNEIIAICGGAVQKSLVSEIQQAKYFSVLADEAADVSNVEQMSIVVRFVDGTSTIREEFLGFTECNEGLTGRAIAKKIKEKLEELGLPIANCRGQGYDGAANMSGKCSGAAVTIQRDYPKAIYVHCRSHVLNLCIASACQIQMVKNMMGHVRVVSEFFNVHPKRYVLLCDKIKSLFPQSRHNHLIDVCRTRWVARIDGLEVFVELFQAIVAALAEVKDNLEGTWSSDSCRDASGLFYGTVSFQFIVTLVVVYRCLALTRPLTKQLQATDYDVVKCVEKVKFLNGLLSKLRTEISVNHNSWFEEATSLAELVDTVPSAPRTVARQLNRTNTPAQTPSEYYQRSLSIPFLDHLCGQISLRFSDTNIAVLSAFHALPAKVVCQQDWRVKFGGFLAHCWDDLPEKRHIDLELDMWEKTWQDYQGTPPSTVQSLLPLIDRLTFPNMYTVFQILATIPVTTCTCERSISALRRLKTYLRSTMKQERLNALALLHVHRDIRVSIDMIIDQFAQKHPRRMKLLDILNADPR